MVKHLVKKIFLVAQIREVIRIKQKIMILLLLIFTGCSKSYKYDLTLCAIFKDEALWLKEWIVYHHDILGIDHFFLYDNDSSDDFTIVLKPFIEKGIVELINWTAKDPAHLHANADGDHMRSQVGAYNDCLKKALGIAKWVGFIDIDEFIVPCNGAASFRAYIRGLEKRRKGSIKLSWRMFGTSDVWDLKSGELLTEKLTFRAKAEHPLNNWFKCLHRPEAVPYTTIHDAPELAPGYRKKHCKPDEFRLHHYWARTGKACLEKRGLQKPDPFLDSLDIEEDRTILQYLPRLKKAMAMWQTE